MSRGQGGKGGWAGRPGRRPASGGLVHLGFGVPLGVLSGCLVFLSFPTWDLFPLQWVSLVPLLVAARGRTLRGGLFLGFLAGLSTNLGGFYWISHVLREFGHMGPAPSWGLTVLVASYQALVFALATGLSAHVATRFDRPVLWFLAFPVLFTACESLVPFIFPWYFANGQQRFHAVTQFVEVTGVAGLTFLLALVNAALAAVVSARIARESFPVGRAITAAVLFLGAVGYGVVRIGEVDRMVSDAPRFKVAVVEPDIGVWEKEAKRPDGSPLPWEEQLRVLYRNLLTHHLLSSRVEREARPDLIVWPESSYFPLHEVYSRATDAVAVAVGSDARVAFVSHDGMLRVDPDAPAALRATGVRAVAAGHEGFVVAVGPRGAAYVRDRDPWRREPTGTDRDLLAVAVAPGTDRTLAVGAQGTAVLREGGRWRTVETGVTVDLRAVTWTGGDTFVAVGERGTAVLLRGGRASHVETGTESDLLAVSFADGAGLWVGGRGGVVLHGDVRALSRRALPTDGAISGIAAGAVTWVLAEHAALFRCQAECRRVRPPAGDDFVSVAGDGTGRAWVLGRKGTVARLRPDVDPTLSVPETPAPGMRAIAFLPFREGYPLPRGVTALYTSDAPLPGGDPADPGPALDADKATPDRDRNAAMRGFRTPLLFGAITAEDDPDRGRTGEGDGSAGGPARMRYYNTALLLDEDGRVLGRYDKNYLLIFGEYLPLSDWFPFLKDWFPEAGDFRPGRTVEVFEMGGVRIGVMVCYEDILPAFTRRLHEKRPHLLVNITNDAWFGRTTEPYQHLSLATFRAVENRRFLVRATNTGVSAIVDPVGRVLQATSLERPEVLVAEVARLEGETLYQRYGDLFAWACCGVGALLVLGTLFRHSGSSGDRATPA